MLTDSISVRFLPDDQQAFGEFCVALQQDGVPFSLGGSLTISLPQTSALEELPENCQKLLRQFQTRNLKIIKIYEIGERRRRLITVKEAERALRKALKRMRQR